MKYVGGKSRIAMDLKAIIEGIMKSSGIDTYIEPFVGGANVIDKIDAKVRIGSDTNKYLIGMYNAVQDGWLPPEDITKEEYYDIRKNKNKYPLALVSVAGFCASFNGKWFGAHYSGSAEIENGTVRNYYKSTVQGLIDQIPSLKGIEFRTGSYEMYSNVENTLIYCDPPYKATYNYLSEFDSDAFWGWVREMSKKNIVIVSEYFAPEDFKVIFNREMRVQFRGNINYVNEKVFTVNNTDYIKGLEEMYDNIDLSESLDGMI